MDIRSTPKARIRRKKIESNVVASRLRESAYVRATECSHRRCRRNEPPGIGKLPGDVRCASVRTIRQLRAADEPAGAQRCAAAGDCEPRSRSARQPAKDLDASAPVSQYQLLH